MHSHDDALLQRRHIVNVQPVHQRSYIKNMHCANRQSEYVFRVPSARQEEVMKLLRFLPSIALFFLITASCEKPTLLAQKIPGYGPNAKACALLPISDLEALYHGKAGTPSGFDDQSGGSICSVSIAGHLAKAQTAAPGDPGAPHSVREAFALIPTISEDTKGKSKFETKDYGKVGCVKLELAATALGGTQKG